MVACAHCENALIPMRADGMVPGLPGDNRESSEQQYV